jgi:hypothetical protein
MTEINIGNIVKRPISWEDKSLNKPLIWSNDLYQVASIENDYADLYDFPSGKNYYSVKISQLLLIDKNINKFPLSDYEKVKAMKDIIPKEFRMNSGKDRIIFSPDHPYFQVPEKDRDFASENFGLPIPDKD